MILTQVLIILYLVSNEDNLGIKKMVSEQLLMAQIVYAQEKDVQENNNNSDEEYDYTSDEQNEKIEWRESEIESKTENDISCWVGWKEYHYGAVTAISKKGDRVKFVQAPYIDINGVYHEGGEKEVETSGYGYYECEGHQHYACPGHIIVTCFGHTNLKLEIKILYYEDMLDEIKGFVN